jgi:hypothetical protein
MTAALLLARAGHRVEIFEQGGELGGLWASRLDADGYFRGDNSCKVYQSGYHTSPALFRLIGTDWKAHFTQRHDLTTDWLRPFIADCSWRDLRVLASAFARSRLGRGRYHEISVTDFMAQRRLSEPCQAWMRATALGGVAGTLRMTMWELFHRLGSNVSEVFRGARGPLYWNQRPPNTPGGFVQQWRDALLAEDVGVHTGAGATRLDPGPSPGSVRLTLESGAEHVAEAIFLAIPPPALGALLAASPDTIAQGFGLSRPQLGQYLRESVYEHVGISYFFDQELPVDLPLGGHNVRRGWHPILVQHGQYREQLRPPARSVVTGSVAVDTRFEHHRLGTLASAHTLPELAEIIWDDERRVDPSLPAPIDIEITGVSSATQVVQRGPLPLSMDRAPVFLATNMHGQAPYFTASLESAIQAGAIAARAFDPRVERLPMGDTDRQRLPWDARGPGSQPGATWDAPPRPVPQPRAPVAAP